MVRELCGWDESIIDLVNISHLLTNPHVKQEIAQSV